MALNPIRYTEKVVADCLCYQLTTYALADDRLYAHPISCSFACPTGVP
jgi:hypothetical protein